MTQLQVALSISSIKAKSPYLKTFYTNFLMSNDCCVIGLNLCLTMVLLKRNSGIISQIVLPRKYHRLVTTELHEDMGHLGTERVLELARQRFFWSCMQADIEYFIQNLCSCVKQRRPTAPTRAPLQPIITTSPFEMISIDFLHLERSKGAINIFWLLSIISRVSLRHMLLETSLLKLSLPNYMTILFYVSNFLLRFTMIRVQNFRITFSIIFKNFVILNIRAQHLITHRGMDKWNVLIVLCYRCFVLYRNRINPVGMSISIRSPMLTTAHGLILRVFRHFIFCLVDTLVYLPT